MAAPRDGPPQSKKRPGPKPRGRSVVALTITVTRTQRTALEALADAQQRSISAIVRQFIADGLGTEDRTDSLRTGGQQPPKELPRVFPTIWPE